MRYSPPWPVGYSFFDMEAMLGFYSNSMHGLIVDYGLIPIYVCMLGYEIFHYFSLHDFKRCMDHSPSLVPYSIEVIMHIVIVFRCFFDALYTYIFRT